MAGSDAPVLSRRSLNRATLARQMLIERQRRPALDVLRFLAGVQGQAGNAPYVALWNRIEGFRLSDLESLILERRAVRVSVMRGTIHMVAADDYPTMQRHFLPVQERILSGSFGRFLKDLDLDAVLEASRSLLAAAPLSAAELGEKLRRRWPDRDRLALSMVGRMLLPLVHVPPAGLWNRGAGPRFMAAEAWLGATAQPAAKVDGLVLRYLAAFGPASVADAQAWCALTKLAAVFERLRPRLATFRSESGRELFDLPDAPRPDADMPAPVRLLADYDNVLLGYADRSRFFGGSPAGFAPKPGYVACLLVDGLFAGFWRLDARAKRPRITLMPRPGLAKRDLKALGAEAEAMLRELCPDRPGEVRLEA